VRIAASQDAGRRDERWWTCSVSVVHLSAVPLLSLQVCDVNLLGELAQYGSESLVCARHHDDIRPDSPRCPHVAARLLPERLGIFLKTEEPAPTIASRHAPLMVRDGASSTTGPPGRGGSPGSEPPARMWPSRRRSRPRKAPRWIGSRSPLRAGQAWTSRPMKRTGRVEAAVPQHHP
jgi:hypothetical protein